MLVEFNNFSYEFVLENGPENFFDAFAFQLEDCLFYLKICTKQFNSVSKPYSLNPDPDPAKYFNPDPEDPWIRIRILAIS